MSPVNRDRSPIDRSALVARHAVVLTRPDPLNPLSVGNGEFAFTADLTGLQTFPDFHETGMPIGTQSQWGWHSFPNEHGYTLDDCTVRFKDALGREVPYRGQLGTALGRDGVPQRMRDAMAFLRGNPHRIDLGRVGLVLTHPDGRAATIGDLLEPRQTLDLWHGVIDSRFGFDGSPVRVTTACHPTRDAIAVRIESPLLRDGRLGVFVRFAGPCTDFRRAYDWTIPEKHQTVATHAGTHTRFDRTLDATRYAMTVASDGLRFDAVAAHEFVARRMHVDAIEFVVEFTPDDHQPPPLAFPDVLEASRRRWETFWSTGGAIDFSGSTDPRAAELERRVVLSQYLTAIQCSGSVPPQETGLVCNSWFGKFHLEMHWWHAAHFALWGRGHLLARSLPWYRRVAPFAREVAAMQGYPGLRWQKMLGPFGPETPSDIGVMLIWQQPHFIHYLELLRRAAPDDVASQRQWADLLFETAEFMAGFATRDPERGHYSLGPPLIPAQEVDGKFFRTIRNPPYELAYWHWGLKTANAWRERLGMPRNEAWDHVADHLSPPPIRDGHYLGHDSEPYLTYADHPSHLMALGFVPPTPLIDADVMGRTYDDVLANWKWPTTWGWDYPVLAMTAARLGRPKDAIDALFLDVQKNTYLANGHNYQDARLPLYLPGNGGLLYAVAMMARGWDGSPDHDAPGFPRDGSWVVRHENLLPAI